MTKSIPEWKLFEKAVAKMLQAIHPLASVRHDVKLPDVHTRTSRQRDVWIEWPVLGEQTMAALVSCKYLSNPLDQQDIDHFHGEFLSSGAQIGIIYSKAGFRPDALEKVRALNLNACRLYENEPPEMPVKLLVPNVFLLRQVLSLKVADVGGVMRMANANTPVDLLKMSFDGNQTLEEIFQGDLDIHMKLDEGRIDRARVPARSHVRVNTDGGRYMDINLWIEDIVFSGKAEYTLLHGEYNLATDIFTGAQGVPVIETETGDPGPGWKRIDELPEEIGKPILLIQFPTKVDELYRPEMKSYSLRSGAIPNSEF